MNKFLTLLLVFQMLASAGWSADLPDDEIAIIPQPVSLVRSDGYFTLPEVLHVELASKSQALKKAAGIFAEKVSRATGYQVSVKEASKAGGNSIRLTLNASPDQELGEEGYHLVSNPEGITIRANKPAGVFYGLETVLKLLPKEIESSTKVEGISWKVPAVEIRDYPRFGWRGMLLDVARHFFTKEEVKSFIDDMVKYKFNMLHLHLTDDQGWRLEIKSLPKLTEVGAWRAPRVGRWGEFTKPSPDEPKTYGGFYTQDDMRELIQYAKDRFVTIMPEIDVPGHSLAALASYPELTCTPGTYQVNAGEKLMVWDKGTFYGLLDNTLCPANEKVYEFLDKVFTEVAQLFPYEYIHMGGDECYKGFWKQSQACQDLMKREGLKDEDELQSYFVKRVSKIINSKGKKLMGWDEILDGGLAEGATVMSWRGMKGGVAAAKAGHHVVMSPNEYAYVDLYQGDPIIEPPTYSMVRLNKAYQFDPVPAGIDPQLILGGQCNLWSERLSTMRHAQYMLWPRGLAIAESVWSPAEKKDWRSFVSRVEKQFERFDVAETNYSRSMYDPAFSAKPDGEGGLLIALETEVEGLEIHYSFDETFPDKFYPVYYKALPVPKEAANLKVITYREGKPVGRMITMPIAELKRRAGV